MRKKKRKETDEDNNGGGRPFATPHAFPHFCFQFDSFIFFIFASLVRRCCRYARRLSVGCHPISGNISLCMCVCFFFFVSSFCNFTNVSRRICGFTRFRSIRPMATQIDPALTSYAQFCLVLNMFTQFYLVLLDFTWFYLVVPSCTQFYRVFNQFYPDHFIFS